MRLSLDELKDSYLKLITTVVPGPASWSYFIPLLLLPLGLLIPPSTLSHRQLCAIVLPTSIAATLHAWSAIGGNDVISTDCLYMTLFLYFFKDPRRSFRHAVRLSCNDSRDLNKLQANGNNENAKINTKPFTLEAYPITFKGRLTWAMTLPQSRPLHDWIIGNPGHDRRVLRPVQHPNRSAFTMDVLSRLLPVVFVFLPLSRQLASNDPYFSVRAWSSLDPIKSVSSDDGKIAGLFRASMPLSMLRPLIMAMYAYSLLLMLFLPPMLIPVFLNTICLLPDEWSPHTWRPHFGPLSAITDHGIRGFWGQWWHQQMRHIVSEPGRWLAAKLRLADNGWQKTVKYMLICASAFTLSGITHSGMVPPRPKFATVGVKALRLSLASFFWIQPVGIAVELFVLEPALRTLPSSVRVLRGLLRFVWTVFFMCSACTLLVVPFDQLGYWDIIPPEYLPHLL